MYDSDFNSPYREKKMMEINWGNLTILKLYKKILINYQR